MGRKCKGWETDVGHMDRGSGRRRIMSDERGGEKRWLDFCLDYELSLSNTEHVHHPRRLYTKCKTRNQIDYIAIEKNCKSYPGANGDTDHRLLVAKMKTKLKQS